MGFPKGIMRAVLAVGLVATVGVGLSATPSAAAEPSAGSVAVEVPAGGMWTANGGASTLAYSCDVGWICFYSGNGGSGSRCRYSTSNAHAATICSWGLDKPRSVWNRTNFRVHYYRKVDYGDRIGSTLSGDRGNLAGTYNIRSLKFTSS